MKRVLAIELALSLSLSACSSHREIDLDPQGLTFDFTFPLIADAHGGALQVLAPFAIQNGDLQGGTFVRVPIVLSRQTLFLIGLSNADILRIEPAFSAARAKEVTASIAPPPSAPLHRVNGTLSDLAVPDSRTLFLLADRSPPALRPATPEEATILSSITLTVPIDPEYCRPAGSSILRAFASDAKLLPGTMQDGTLEHIARVDDARVLGLSRVASKLYLFLRGSRPGQPASMIDLGRASGGFATATGLAVERGTSMSDPVRILIAGRTIPCADPPSCTEGTVWEASLIGTELSMATTSTRVMGVALTSAAIDSRGRTIVTGENGTLLVREAGAPAFHRPAPLPTFTSAGGDAELSVVAPISDPMKPHAVAGIFRLFFGDVDAGSTSFDMLARNDGQTLSFRWLEQIQNAQPIEIWAVGKPSSLFRRIEGGRTAEVKLSLPPRYGPCLSQGLDTPEEYRASSGSGDYAYVVSKCNAAVRVRRADLCTSVIASPGNDIAPAPELFSVDASSSPITFGGVEGTVLEIDQ